jgi:hypothetical protein
MSPNLTFGLLSPFYNYSRGIKKDKKKLFMIMGRWNSDENTALIFFKFLPRVHHSLKVELFNTYKKIYGRV